MALINCPECGKEISDTANKCPHCGYVRKSILNNISGNKKRSMTIAVAIIVIACIVLTISILLRPNIKMNDFDIKNGKVATILFLGLPSETDGDEWEYEDCGIKFYDIPVSSITYDISDGKYSLLFDGEYEENLKNILEKHCDDAKYVYLFTEYTYKELEISVDYGVDFCLMYVD